MKRNATGLIRPAAAAAVATSLAATFTATTPGTYRYLCAVPGHARQGMTGAFIVAGAGHRSRRA